MSKKKIIAIDFDGTCVAHRYPSIGKDIGAVPTLRQLTGQGHKLILYTMRSGAPLSEAEAWFEYWKIPLWAVNQNPQQSTWTSSPKPYAHVYIDDAALGCPLLYDPEEERPYVDWKQVRAILANMGFLPK